MPEIPDGAKKPKDHAAKAAKAEALGEPLAIEFRGQTYTISREVGDDVEIMELMGDLDEQPFLLPKLTRNLLGSEQWAQFKDSSRDPETGRIPAQALGELFVLLNESLGK